jgi:hypothetical protein
MNALTKASLLVWGVSFSFLAAGCGNGITAAEIMDDYGILNRCDLQKDIAGVIQSGQADYMVDAGHCRVRNWVKEKDTIFGSRRVLVTEYLIHGEVYRVDVRRAINPMKNVPLDRVHYAEYQKETDHKTMRGGHLEKVYAALRDHSYEAKAEVAYRAWRGLDGKVRPVRVLSQDDPDWVATEGALDLYFRTKEWPMADIWFRGLTSDGRREDPQAGHPGTWNGPYADTPRRATERREPAVGHHTQGPEAMDGRWIMEDPGPGVQHRTIVDGRSHFVNLHLFDALGIGSRLEDT